MVLHESVWFLEPLPLSHCAVLIVREHAPCPLPQEEAGSNGVVKQGQQTKRWYYQSAHQTEVECVGVKRVPGLD